MMIKGLLIILKTIISIISHIFYIEDNTVFRSARTSSSSPVCMYVNPHRLRYT